MQEPRQDLWQEVMAELEKDIGKTNLNMWFSLVDFVGIKGDSFVLQSVNQFSIDQIKKRFEKILLDAIESVTLHRYSIEYKLAEEDIKRKPKPVENGNEEIKYNNLNQRYTFDNFVVGKSNNFAHAASVAVAESPATDYNPLFIYGSSGLGKTHLMHAIGNFMMENDPDIKPMYVSSEQFTNELVEALRKDNAPEFRQKYRNVDLLLVDDIQFLIGKEGIQEEFFHTFNALHQGDKQIVVTSDKPPNELKGLESRIITRLGGGLIADIKPPDIETRIAILRNKNERESFGISDEIIDYIAENIDSNIRELEGALLRILAYSNLTSAEIDLKLAQTVLKDLLKQRSKIVINTDRIKKIISETYGVSVEDLDSKKRPKDIAYARQVAMYLSREMTDLSLPKIGADFGGRDHTTVIHAIDKISKEIKLNPSVKKNIEEIKKKIKGE